MRSQLPRRKPLILAALLGALAIIVGLHVAAAAQTEQPQELLPFTIAAVSVPLAFKRGDYDAELNKTHALPNGAATTQSASGINLGVGERSGFLSPLELLINAPALTTTELGDTQTITYSLEFATASDFSAVLESVQLFTQTGAGAAGAAAVERRYRPHSGQAMYCRLKTVKTGVSNASTKSATLKAMY